MPHDKPGSRRYYHDADDVTLSTNIVEAVADTQATLHQSQVYRWAAQDPAAGARAKARRQRSRHQARRVVHASRPQGDPRHAV